MGSVYVFIALIGIAAVEFQGLFLLLDLDRATKKEQPGLWPVDGIMYPAPGLLDSQATPFRLEL